MTDRPIIFSAPMIRALLDGRKSQTRRALKPQPICHVGAVPSFSWGRYHGLYPDDWFGYGNEIDGALPYRPGDRLWVREAYSGPYAMGDIPPRDWRADLPVWYWADGNPEDGDWTKPKPGIHMPRWASRLTLIVTDVRVQRLQDISNEDAIAEGTEPHGHAFTGYGKQSDVWMAPYYSFAILWTSIHGPDAWDANPWVAAISFETHKCNIDKMPGGNHE